ncbi:probable family 17 glucosidase SCW11 [Portunus trituberculatus]|uniref:probable family 17 glucosidase SCW11 n=1 Tax=Portunus trituberculatus TaxID=210409 RepID=UPI001E1CC933|nr:probable family 17 glucosidase SCW11 [Portunus trituberculatus]
MWTRLPHLQLLHLLLHKRVFFLLFIVLLLLLLLAQEGHGDISGSRRELPAHKRQSVQYSTLVGPSFLNVSAHAHAHARTGHTAYLTCVVRNLHNYTVSWVRASDIHLLTAGETTYTSDHRFVAVNPGGGPKWVLRLHHARPKDAGTYLCQVSVTPPISTSVNLLVTEASARVFPGPEVFLKASSRLVLVCEVRGCPYPAHPTWQRGNKVEGGTQVEEGHVTASTSTPAYEETTTTTSTTTTTTTLLASHNTTNTFTTTVTPSTTTAAAPTTTATTTTTTPTPIGLPIARVTLVRPKAKAAHSGVYTCMNSCTPPINLTLHVLIGDEETAAMQHLSGSPRPSPLSCWLLPVLAAMTSLLQLMTS